LLDLGEVHGGDLGGGELLLLAQVCDLSADLAVDVDEGCGDEVLLDFDIGVVEGAAGQTCEGRDGVLEVRDLLVLCGLSDVPALGAEAN
jgi:hypothetical protein